MVEQMGGEAVPQGVRRGPGVDPGDERAPMDEPVDRAGAQAFASPIQEDRPRIRAAGPFGEARLECAHGGPAQRGETLAASLAAHACHSMVEVEVVAVEADQLRDAQAAAIERLQDGAVACVLRGGDDVLSPPFEARFHGPPLCARSRRDAEETVAPIG